MESIYSSLYTQYGKWWWCSDEALKLASSLLLRDNYVKLDNFLGKDEFNKVHKEIIQAHQNGLISLEGKVGGGRDGQSISNVDKEIRNDVLGWMDCSNMPSSSAMGCYFEDNDKNISDKAIGKQNWSALTNLIQFIESIVFELKPFMPDELKNVKTRSKIMCTFYPGPSNDTNGSRYTSHFDNANGNGRRITAIYYLNKNYEKQNGGCLRIHQPNTSTKDLKPKVDIEPIADRLVLFFSDKRVPHEVLPTYKDRYAVTVWFFDSIEKANAMKKSKDPKNAVQNIVDTEVVQLGDLTELD